MKNIQPILFVAACPTERPAKLALGLRRCNIPVMFLYINKPSYDPLKYFDFAIQCETTEECINIARKLKPKIIHLFSFHADPVAFLLTKEKFSKVIYDYKDTFQNMISVPENPNLWAAQRFLVENADGLCCRDLQLAQYLRLNNINTNAKKIFFPDYCWNDNINAPKKVNPDEVHFVLMGTFMPERVDPTYISHGYLYTSKVLTMCGIHTHIYPSYNTHVTLMQNDAAQDYLELAKGSPFFHLHTPLPSDQILTEISQYDFGLTIMQGPLFGIEDKYLMNQSEKYGIATRVFDYLEAGLEVVTQPEMSVMYRLLRNKDVATPLTKNLITEICTNRTFNKLFDLFYKRKESSRERAITARDYYAIERHIPRLLKFYESLL